MITVFAQVAIVTQANQALWAQLALGFSFLFLADKNTIPLLVNKITTSSHTVSVTLLIAVSLLI